MSKLIPTQVSEATMGEVAFDGVRRRPVVAIDDNGDLVVCCRRTATTHGWKLQGSLHTRSRVKVNAKGKLEVEAAPAPKRRAMDKKGQVSVSAPAVKAIKATAAKLDQDVDALLK